MDSPATNREFAESLGLDYPILSDPSGEVARAWGCIMKPFGVPARWTFYIGKDGTILHVDRDVKPSTAGKDIAARLEALGIPRAEGTGAPGPPPPATGPAPGQSEGRK